MSFKAEEYSDIFNARAASYHRAMRNQPCARDREFQIAVELAGLQAGQWVVDIPSGGGYLAAYLPVDCALLQIEASEVFAQLNPEGLKHATLVASQFQLPLKPNSMDCVISIAGLHHCQDKRGIFKQLFRVLKPSGSVVLADVQSESSEAAFLDTFVHAHNSMGHQGLYLDASTAGELREAGFAIDSDQVEGFRWNFESEDVMAVFCKDMFGMDRATSERVAEGIARYQGYETIQGVVCMNWKLRYIRANKPC